MRDPLIHTERNVIFTHQTISEVIAGAVSLAIDAPKTVTTGCAKRRPYVMTSADPDKVTCLACRDHAANEHESHARIAALAADLAERNGNREQIQAFQHNRDEHEAMAERFRRLPNEQ